MGNQLSKAATFTDKGCKIVPTFLHVFILRVSASAHIYFLAESYMRRLTPLSQEEHFPNCQTIPFNYSEWPITRDS